MSLNCQVLCKEKLKAVSGERRERLGKEGFGSTTVFPTSSWTLIDNETGWYAEAGLDFGGDNGRFFVEGMWRKLDTSISLGVFDADTKFDGIAANVGVVWRWGK